MKSAVQELKKNLVRAAYPRGGGEHLAHAVLGVPEEAVVDARANEKYETFNSLKQRKEDAQSKKLKTLSEAFDPPKRVEIKELELALRQLVEFSDIDTKRKTRICREVAFIVKDMAQLYNLCNDGGPQIQMEFLGYKSEQDERKVFNPKPTTFTYFNRLRRKHRPRFPISDHLTNQDYQVPPLKHEDDPQQPRFHQSISQSRPAGGRPGSGEGAPYSDQEHELHRIRDRIRIRLNLIDVDFKNLESQLTLEQQRKVERKRQLEEMLDGDRMPESEKERPPSRGSDGDLDEVHACIKANRKLME